jgi:signal transduction histidine kinase
MTTILVIEDDANIRRAIVDILELAGYETLSAPDGLAGVKLARTQRPDLVVCDIMMPFLDGYGVVKQLRQDTTTSMIPFIFLTSRSTKADLRAGMAMGADDYLTKPFVEEELLSAVQTRLERKTRLVSSLESRLEMLRQDIARSLPHELRTPLHGVLAGAAFLRDEYASLTQDDVREMVEIVYESAQRLERLVQNHLLYLELTLLATQPHVLRTRYLAETTDIAPFIETTARREASAAGRDRDLHLNLQQARVPISQVHLAKIIEELLSNAFKFSDPGTPVEIAIQVNGSVSLRVTEHGHGMSADQIADVGAYVQFDRRRHEQQGVGLGLTVVKLLANSYGGSLHIDSTPGEHTTVCVNLPPAEVE